MASWAIYFYSNSIVFVLLKSSQPFSRATPEELQTFESAVNEVQPQPNPEQYKAILHILQSESVVSNILGAPGTGKTFTEIVLAQAHGRIPGRRVILAAPRNEAAIVIIDAFKSHNEQLPPHEWVYFTSAPPQILPTMNEAKKEYFESENAMWRYINSAGNHSLLRNWEWTFAHRLKERIDVQSNDPSSPVHQHFKDYLQAYITINNSDDHGHIAQSMKELEALEHELCLHYLRSDIKFVVCNISLAGHDILLESGVWHELIIDEATDDTLRDVLRIFGSHVGKIGHISLFSDPKGVVGRGRGSARS